MYVDDIKLAGKNMSSTLKILMTDFDIGEPTSLLDHVCLDCTPRACQISKDTVDNYRNMFGSKISVGATEKPSYLRNLAQTFPHGPMTKKCVEIYCELANKTTEQLYKVATPCMYDHQFREEENGSVRELSTVCSQIVVK